MKPRPQVELIIKPTIGQHITFNDESVINTTDHNHAIITKQQKQTTKSVMTNTSTHLLHKMT